MIHILVTGGEGQLAQCLKHIAIAQTELKFRFVSRNELDITNKNDVNSFFKKHSFDYCINTAAYTQVDLAEKEKDKAFKVNAEGVKHLAKACKEHQITLLQVSTDYVFDGTKNTPYIEEDTTHPINVYGASKLEGEQEVREILDRYFIVRTSWLYSLHGTNFLNSVLQWITARKQVSITTEQTGSPTNANDVAAFLVHIIKSNSTAYGTYHFSNQGETTWYGFAKAIAETVKDVGTFTLASTDHYSTFAKRPAYSVLDCTKAEEILSYKIKHWKDSLINILQKTNNH